ncbi:MAG: zf-TFIIB domain-containing protein [Phycisphaerales bacterium]|nr:zf-TFIIB domain-containing protein [Phycisphaerales bacterium]
MAKDPKDTSHHVPSPLPEDEHRNPPIDCPKCRAPMKHIRVGEVLVDRCYACAGLWLDALEKEKLLGDRKAAAAADHPAGPKSTASRGAYKCPRDHSTLIEMSDIRQSHVRFESCTVCGGVFLDAGELKDLSERTLRERLLGR